MPFYRVFFVSVLCPCKIIFVSLMIHLKLLFLFVFVFLRNRFCTTASVTFIRIVGVVCSLSSESYTPTLLTTAHLATSCTERDRAISRSITQHTPIHHTVPNKNKKQSWLVVVLFILLVECVNTEAQDNSDI